MRNKKKVLHVITDFNAKGGAEVMLSRVLRGMNSVDEEHFLISLMSVQPDLFANGCQCNYYEIKLNSFLGFLRIFKAVFVAIRYSPTVVFGWMYHGCIASSIFSLFCLKKNVWNIRHSLDNLSVESKSTRFSIWLCKVFSFYPSRIIYNSKKALKQHAMHGFCAGKAAYIPNGFYVEDFKVRPLRSQINKRMLCVGRNHPSKGFSDFLNMLKNNNFFHEHEDASITVIGRGVSSLGDANKELTKSGSLVLIEEMPDLSRVYSEYDYFILTSLNEGFPNVLCEAAIAGLACLSTAAGDSQIILGNDGLIFDRLSYASFNRAFECASRLIGNEEAMKKFRASFLHRYSMSNVLDEYRLVLFG